MRKQTCIILITFTILAPALAADDWDGLVKKYVGAYESIKEPAPTAYPWVAKRLKTLFGVRDVGHIQVSSEADSKRTLVMDIYYKPVELHVINHKEGWNLVTKGKEAFEWRTGEKEGLITKLNDKDLIDYLLYVTDPSCIMTCLYHAALNQPRDFLQPKETERGITERRFTKPVNGFQAVFVSEEPAWLCGAEYLDQKSGKTERQMYSKPKSLKDIPAEVFNRLKELNFKQSNLSIRRHLVYL